MRRRGLNAKTTSKNSMSDIIICIVIVNVWNVQHHWSVSRATNKRSTAPRRRQLGGIAQQTPMLATPSQRRPDSALACNMRLSHTQPNATGSVHSTLGVCVTILSVYIIGSRTYCRVSIDFWGIADSTTSQGHSWVNNVEHVCIL